MCISGTEASSVILVKTKQFQKFQKRRPKSAKNKPNPKEMV